MGKLEQYAKKLEAKKAKARARIKELEDLGYTVSEALKRSANAPEVKRVTKKTLMNQPNLDLRRINASAKFSIDLHLKNPYTLQPLPKGDVNATFNASTFARNLNKALKNAPDIDTYNDLATYIKKVSGSKPKKGLETDMFKISDDYDPKKPLKNYITFKNGIRPDDFIQILNIPQTTAVGKKVYDDDWKHRSYTSNVNALAKKKMINGNTMDKLEKIMNTSQAWNIAKKGMKYEDGKKDGSIQGRWGDLYNALSDLQDANDDNALNTLISMIENEEDFDDIMYFVDSIIGG